MKPTKDEVDKALAGLDDSPRNLARERLLAWKSNAQRRKLPVSNRHDTKGAPDLPVKRALSHEPLDRLLGKK